MKKRIESLDWLRGLMALSIMFYHLSGSPNASKLIDRLGIYGVSIFFILSGLSMALVYEKFIRDIRTSISFLIRRIFRIFPLLWLVILLVVVPNFDGNHYSFGTLFLNFTGLFGILKPNAYINEGAWSIGNEMVYYLLTPLIIALYNKKRILGNLFTAATIAIGMHFAFFLLSPGQDLAQQWSMYINPLNNMFLYCSGIALYYNFKGVNIKNHRAVAIGVLSISAFILVPVHGNQIILVTGINRIIFSAISLCIVFSFYKAGISLIKIIKVPLEQFGIATYGVYLLHPVVRFYLNLFVQNNYIEYAGVVILTIAAALLSFNLYEKPMMGLGKRLTSSGETKVKTAEKIPA